MFSKYNVIFTLFLAATLGVGTYYYLADTGSSGENHSEHHHDHDHGHDEHEGFVQIDPSHLESAGIVLSEAAPGRLVKEIHSPGKITMNADRMVHIYPKVAGIAKEAKKNMGEQVGEGDVIAVIESREMAEAKAAYLNALIRREIHGIALQREQNLYDKKITTLADYQTAIADAESSDVDWELSRQKLFTMGMGEKEIASIPENSPEELRYYEMRAPFNSTILTRDLTPGQLLNTDSKVYVLADLSSLWIELSIYPQDLPYAKSGQKVQINGANGQTSHATIMYLSPVVDDATRRSTAIAVLENPRGEWHAGTFVTAIIEGDETPVAIAVPKEAIQKMDGQDSLFIASGEGFKIRPVRIGRSDAKSVEILAGLQQGEKYASKNTFLLKAEHEKSEAEHVH